MVKALIYTLMLASLSHKELTSLPPIPLASPEGITHDAQKLLLILTSHLESTLHLNCRGPLTFRGDFTEMMQWSLCVFKNLTRPNKLSRSSATGTEEDGDNAIATYILLDAGVVPLLLCVVCVDSRRDRQEVGEECCSSSDDDLLLHRWNSNSLQDVALYTLLHLASILQVQGILREGECGCIRNLSWIVECGTSSEKLRHFILDSVDDDDDAEKDGLSQLGLQAMKAVGCFNLVAD